MLTVHHLSKSFNLTTLFEDVTFSVNVGDRAALIGANGSGKTTLLRIVAGQEIATAGSIALPHAVKIGYLPQGFELDPTRTLGEIIGRSVGSIDILEDELTELTMQMVEQPDDVMLHERFDQLLRRIESADTGRAATITHALGLDDIDPDLPAGVLSGGQKTRLALALVLLGEPDLLLLDEPTNHLDITMLEWLEHWLANFAGAVLFVSHDRTFIDRTATKILDLNPQQHNIKEYVGNYSDYLAQWQAEREKRMQAYLDQVAEVKRIKKDVARVRETARSQENKSTSVRKGGEKMKLKGYKDFVRSKAKATAQLAKGREQKLDRYLNSDQRVEKPSRSWQMNVEFGARVRIGRSVLHLKNLTIGYDQPLLHIPEGHVSSGQRIILTGANGSGKTTLLKVIAGKLQPLEGQATLGGSVKLGYMAQEQELLDPAKSPVETLRDIGFGTETDIRNYLHNYLFKGQEPLKPTALLSYGQRARLQLAVLVAQGCNFLLLDEPINHLDIPSREMFEQALLQFNGTTLAVVHDRYFIGRFATEVWWVENGGVRREIR